MLVLLGEYKEILDISGSDEDEFVEQAALEIEEKVKNFLNRDLEVLDYAELYDGTDSPGLILNQYPINSVSKIEVYDGLDGNTEVWDELTQGTDYERLIIPTGKFILLMDGLNFPIGMQNIRVTYNAGYSAIPLEIQQACKKLMLLYYGQIKKTKSLGISSVSQSNVASGTTTYDKDEEAKIFKDIEKFKNINI